MPLPIPSRPWEYISMEYLLGYPTTKHQHDTILVVVRRFSKMVIVIPCKKTTTSQLFFEHVWKQFGLLTTTNSDRDAKFQHILEDSLVTYRHETFFIENFPSIDKRTDESCESLGSTITSHVQPQASLDMGRKYSIHTTQLKMCSKQLYVQDSIRYMLWISTLSAHRIDQLINVVKR